MSIVFDLDCLRGSAENVRRETLDIYSTRAELDDTDIELGALLPDLPGVRKVGNATRTKFGGSVFSDKMLSHVAFDSLLESRFLKILDVTPGVLGFISQPFRLSYSANQKKRTYVPDYGVLRRDADGNLTVEIVEVKPLKHLTGPVREKLIDIKTICNLARLNFRVVSDRNIRPGIHLSNAELVRDGVRLAVPKSLGTDVRDFVASGNRSVADIIEVFNLEWPQFVYAMILRGWLNFNRLEKLHDRSAIVLGSITP